MLRWAVSPVLELFNRKGDIVNFVDYLTGHIVPFA